MIYTADYITVTEATTYFSTRLYASAWSSASAGDKASAIHMATQAIDSLRLKGQKYDPDQVNAFPRMAPTSRGQWSIIDYNDVTNLAIVPQAVKDAVAEEALELLRVGNSARTKLQREGVKSFSRGGTYLREDYDTTRKTYGLMSPEAARLIRQYIAGSAVIY